MFLRRIFPGRTHTRSWSRALLLSMGLLDELITGIPVVALPLLRDRLGLSYAQIGLLFTAAVCSGMILEPCMNLLSDRHAKKPWILAGLLVLAVGYALIGNATSYGLLLLAFMVSYPAGGAAVDLAQSVVIDADSAHSTHTMTRWTLLSSIGDFLAPLVVTSFVALHAGWTALCWLASALWLIAALLLAPLRFPARGTAAEVTEDEDAAHMGIWVRLREALRDPLLLRWAALSIIPTMLDEVFLSFVVLYLHDTLHASEALITLIVTAQMLASFVGLFALEQLLKRTRLSPPRLLTGLSLLALAGVLVLLAIHILWLVIGALLVISLSCAGWYPLAMAQAYARKPTNSGVVRTVIGLGAPFDMLLPGAIGLIAARFGVLAGLGVLGLAPVLVLLLLPRRYTSIE